MKRRKLLGGIAATAFTAASAKRVLGANDRVVVGLIGCGGRGRYVARLMREAPGVDFGAVCDVYEPNAAKAREWAAANRPKGEQESISRWSVARQLRALGRVDEALAAQRKLAAENDKDGFVPEEMGECLLLLGREAEAKPCFRRAHEILKEIGWMAEDKARIERLARLGG